MLNVFVRIVLRVLEDFSFSKYVFASDSPLAGSDTCEGTSDTVRCGGKEQRVSE